MIDLHIHSCYSDGEFPPEKIMEYLSERNFKKVSITDHDTIAKTIDKAFLRAKALRIQLMTGIEITADYKGAEIHLLGYDFNLDRLNRISDLNVYLQNISSFYQETGKKICKLIQKSPATLRGKDGKTCELSFSESELKATGQGVSTHTGLVGILINRKLKQLTGETVNPYETMKLFLRQIESVKEKYKDFIQKHDIKFGEKTTTLYNAKPELISVKQAVEFIIQCGGIPVIAHPCEQHLDAEQLPSLRSMGVLGIEVYSPKNGTLFNNYLELANRLNFIKTGGTDWHGPESMLDIIPGYYSKDEKIPLSCWDEIKEAKSSM